MTIKPRVWEEDSPDLMYKHACMLYCRASSMCLLHEDVRITCLLDAFHNFFVLIHALGSIELHKAKE